ncbi:MAG: hypothetical protein AAFX50_22520, partial [Acidobacteriota bacterium]
PMFALRKTTDRYLSLLLGAFLTVAVAGIQFAPEANALHICPNGWTSCTSPDVIGCCTNPFSSYRLREHCTEWDNDIVQADPLYCTYKVVRNYTREFCGGGMGC